MRKFSAIALVVAFALLMVGPPATGGEIVGESIGVRYIWDGPIGELTIANAPGYVYRARASNGQMMAKGLVESPYFTVTVPNAGPDMQGTVLWVNVGDILFQVMDWDWQWD